MIGTFTMETRKLIGKVFEMSVTGFGRVEF